jgi:hypothetical protein
MFSDVKKTICKSWKENFEQVYLSLSTFDKEIIKNINILYECKEQEMQIDSCEHLKMIIMNK